MAQPAPPVTGRLRRVGLPQLLIGAILLLAIIPATAPVSDPDFFWHLRVGRWILDHGMIPTHDLFTFTVPDHRFVAHEWLSEVIMAVLTGIFGLGGVTIYFAIITWGGFLGILRTVRAGYVIAGAGLAIGFLAGGPIWGPRTQMITFAFVVVLLLWLRRFRESHDRRWLYPIPILFVFWVNLHAGFTIGLIFLIVTVAGEWAREWFRARAGARADVAATPMRPLMAVLGLSLVAVLLNPNLAAIYVYAAQTQFSTAQQKLIVEWFSPDFHLIELRAFEAMLLLVICLLVGSPQKPRLTDMLLLLAGLVLALQSVRHIALFVAIATPIMIELGQATWEANRVRLPRLREPRPSGLIGGINLAVLALLGVLALSHVLPAIQSGFRSKAVTRDYPVAAVDFVASDPPPGHVFNQYGWGGYLVYRMWPQLPVFIYGDAAVMGDPFLNEYQSVAVLQRDYLGVLDRRGVTWVIYSTGQPLEVVLQQTPGWRLVYQDKVASVLVRSGPETESYLARYAAR
ncbi:MAG TPA: hypothetical protein VNV65_10790 [Candidatus Solibacter sp.]|jgi:hypothetical protein|nr:hypothetical protein [Candidatus Solibacter sp.]